MTVKNGLYSIQIEMKDGGRGRATGVIVLLDGKILGAIRISITQVPTPSLRVYGDLFRWKSRGRRNRAGREKQRSVSCQADAKVIVIAGKERP